MEKTPEVSWRPETLVALDAAERALGVVRSRAGASDVTSKGGRDIVTATDVAVEDLVRGVLGEGSDRPVIGEERGGEPPTDGAAYWLVDPICGTRNFASGIPLYCVNLALVEGDEIVAAVVADPSTGEIDVAERGRGAWAVGDPARRLRASAYSHIVSFGEDHTVDGGRRARSARFIADAIMADRWELRALSSTLSLPYVAAGRIAAYVLFGGTALHTGAGSLLAAEAGAVVSDIEGAPWTIRSTSIVAGGTPELHRELIALGTERRPG